MKKLFTLTFLSIFGLTFAQVPSYVPSNGLVGWWPFNGNANDESGNGNNGTVNGATLTADRNGVANSAYSFDGVNDRIGTIPLIINQNFTASIWCNIGNNIFQYPLGLGINNITQDGFGLGFSSNSPSCVNLLSNRFFVFDAVNSPCYNVLNSNTISSTNTWVNIVLVKNGSTITLYKNGLFEASNNVLNLNINALSFGVRSDLQFFFNGKLDDIGIWNRALTASEISGLYTSTPPPTFSIQANGCPNVSYQPTNFTPNTGSTYQWTITPSAGAQNSTGLNTANPSFIFNSGGTYSVTVQETNNGNTLTSAPVSISILDLTNLTPSVSGSVMQNINGVNTFLICSGPNTTSALVYNENWGMTNPTNTTYSYTINNGAQIPITTSTTVPIIYGNNTFTLTATNGVCALTNTINIYSGANPFVSLGTSNSIGLCPGNALTFTIDPTQSVGVNNSPGTTYSLVFSDNLAATVNISNLLNDTIIPHQYNVTSCGLTYPGNLYPANTFYAQVTAQNYCGQTSSTVSPITVNDFPTANFTVTDSTICANQSITVTNTGDAGSVVGNNAPYNCFDQGKFYWTISGGSSGIDFNVTAGVLGSFNNTYNNPNGSVNTAGNGSSILNITFNTAGTYTITQHYHNGCGTKTFVRNIQVGGITSVALTVNDSPCAATATGSATVTLTGGIAPITYSWTRNGTAFTATPANAPTNLTAANAPGYVLTATDACGSQVSNTITLTNAPPLTLYSAVGTNALCNGGNGTIVGVIQGGTAPRSLTATNTANNSLTYTTATATGSPSAGQFEYTLSVPAGTYTVSASDGLSSCVSSINTPITVTQPAIAVTATTAKTDVCFGGTNGTITVTATGGTGTLQYSIDGGTTYQASNVFTGLAAGTYSIVVTDANNCTTTPASVTINQSAGISATTIVTNVLCNGGSTGSINLTVLGGASPYNYAWTGPASFTATIEDLTNRPAGAYGVSVTDANGCNATATTIITQPPVFSASAVKTNIYCFGGANGTITASATGGTAPYTYSINTITFQSSPNFTGLASGNYIVTVKDANNCTTNSANLNITQPDVLSISNDGITSASCVNTANGSIFITVLGGVSPYTYAWSGPNGFTSTAQDQSSNLAQGTYAVTVMDANGCPFSLTSIVISSPLAINISTTATNVTCYQGTNGAINATVTGGSAPYFFVWKKNGVNFATTEDLNGIGVGSYTLEVTDANFCLSSPMSPVIISEGPEIIATITPNGPTTFCSGGSVVLTSSATTGISWSNGATTQSINVSQSGSYTVTVSNGSCSVTSTPTLVTINPSPIIQSSTLSSICSGNIFTYIPVNNPPSTIVPNGTFYNWTPISNPIIINEQSGTGSVITGQLFSNSTNTVQNQVYTVIPQIGNCSGAPFMITISVQPEIAILNATMNICNNSAFTFNPSSNGVNIIPAGTMYTWSVANNINISGLLNNSTPSSVINGTLINLTPTVQTAVYTVIPQTLNCLGAPFALTITILPSINATINSQQTNYCSGQDPQVITSIVNSVPGTLVYQWMTSSSSTGPWSNIMGANASIYDPGISIINSGYYQLNITSTYSGSLNCYGASNPLYLLVEPVPSVPTITSNGPTTFCSGGTIVLTSSSSTGNTWSNGATTQSITANQSSSYTVTASSGSCSATSTPTIVTVNPLPIVSCSPNQTICNGESTVLAGSGATSYTWSNGITDNLGFSPTATQTYVVQGTDDNGCVNIDSVTVIVNDPTTSTQSVTTCDSYTLNGQTYTSGGIYTQVIANTVGCDSTITLDLTLNYSPSTPIVTIQNEVNLSTSNNTGVTFQWIFCSDLTPIAGQTNSSFNPSANGLYAVVVTNGCGSDTSECAVISTIGFNDLSDNEIKLYPNPNDGQFYLEVPEQLTNQQIEIFDLNGRLVFKQELNATLNLIQTEKLARGSYLLEFVNNKPIYFIIN